MYVYTKQNRQKKTKNTFDQKTNYKKAERARPKN